MSASENSHTPCTPDPLAVFKGPASKSREEKEMGGGMGRDLLTFEWE